MTRWEVTLRGLRGFKAYIVVDAVSDPQARMRAIRLSLDLGNPVAWVDACDPRTANYPLTPAPTLDSAPLAL